MSRITTLDSLSHYTCFSNETISATSSHRSIEIDATKIPQLSTSLVQLGQEIGPSEYKLRRIVNCEEKKEKNKSINVDELRKIQQFFLERLSTNSFNKVHIVRTCQFTGDLDHTKTQPETYKFVNESTNTKAKQYTYEAPDSLNCRTRPFSYAFAKRDKPDSARSGFQAYPFSSNPGFTRIKSYPIGAKGNLLGKVYKESNASNHFLKRNYSNESSQRTIEYPLLKKANAIPPMGNLDHTKTQPQAYELANHSAKEKAKLYTYKAPDSLNCKKAKSFVDTFTIPSTSR